MPRFSVIILAALLTASLGAEEVVVPDWTKIKAGIDGDEALKHLGEPLVRTRGRGFEVWIYDGKGEAVFAGGPLKSWTAASPSAESVARPVTQDVLIRPVRRRNTRLAPLLSLPPPTYQDLSASRFRYAQ